MVTKLIYDALSFKDAATHQMWDSSSNDIEKNAPSMIILKTRSEVKVTVTQTRYATLGHHKTHPHTKFGIPTSKNICYVDSRN